MTLLHDFAAHGFQFFKNLKVEIPDTRRRESGMRTHYRQVGLAGHPFGKLKTGLSTRTCHYDTFDISFLQSSVDNLHNITGVLITCLLEIENGLFNAMHKCLLSPHPSPLPLPTGRQALGRGRGGGKISNIFD
jgi:hypothetical protein